MGRNGPPDCACRCVTVAASSPSATPDARPTCSLRLVNGLAIRFRLARINLPSRFAVFPVSCVSAPLVGILSGPGLSFPAHRSFAESLKAVGWLLSQVVRAIPSWTVRQVRPRAPPI